MPADTFMFRELMAAFRSSGKYKPKLIADWFCNRVDKDVPARRCFVELDHFDPCSGATTVPSSDGSVTGWLDALRAGDPQAPDQLWDRYFPKIVELARQRMLKLPQALSDEEDVALSVFKSLCLRVSAQQFPDLRDRDGLWRLLVTMTYRKVAERMRYERRIKRGGQEKFTRNRDGSHSGQGRFNLDDLISGEPSPDDIVAIAEERRFLLEQLKDDQLRTIAVLRMDGYEVSEIARIVRLSTRSVERKLKLIRDRWNSLGLTDNCE